MQFTLEQLDRMLQRSRHAWQSHQQIGKVRNMSYGEVLKVVAYRQEIEHTFVSEKCARSTKRQDNCGGKH